MTDRAPRGNAEPEVRAEVGRGKGEIDRSPRPRLQWSFRKGFHFRAGLPQQGRLLFQVFQKSGQAPGQMAGGDHPCLPFFILKRAMPTAHQFQEEHHQEGLGDKIDPACQKLHIVIPEKMPDIRSVKDPSSQVFQCNHGTGFCRGRLLNGVVEDYDIQDRRLIPLSLLPWHAIQTAGRAHRARAAGYRSRACR